MLHECKDYLRDDACIVCEASLGVVNVLRRLRHWEQVIEGAFTKDQILYDLKRLVETHENRLERDRSLSESPTVTMFRDGQEVTFEVIPTHTRAGHMVISEFLRIVRSIRGVQYALAEHFNGDRLQFWHLLVGHVPACQSFMDDLLSALSEVPFEGSDMIDTRPTTPLPLLQGKNDLRPAQEQHAVPAGVSEPIRPPLPLAEPKPLLCSVTTPVVLPSREPAHRAAAAPPVAAGAPTVATAARPIAGTRRFKKAQSSLDDSITEALDTKVNEVAQRTAVERDGRKYIPRYLCFFCGWSGQADPVRVDQPHNHRTGQSLKRCKVYTKLGGKSNLFKVASFLIARWPELLGRRFEDNQIVFDGDLQKALRGYEAKDLSSKAQLALANYEATKRSPPAGKGYQDDELMEDKETDELMDDEETDELMDDEETDELMEDNGT